MTLSTLEKQFAERYRRTMHTWAIVWFVNALVALVGAAILLRHLTLTHRPTWPATVVLVLASVMAVMGTEARLRAKSLWRMKL